MSAGEGPLEGSPPSGDHVQHELRGNDLPTVTVTLTDTDGVHLSPKRKALKGCFKPEVWETFSDYTGYVSCSQCGCFGRKHRLSEIYLKTVTIENP